MPLSQQVKEYMTKLSKVDKLKVEKAKKLSAYNVFCMEKRSTLTGDPMEIMKQLGALWKSTSENDRKVFVDKAVELNLKATETFVPSEVPETDPHVEELKTMLQETFKTFKKLVVKRDKQAKKAAEEPKPEELKKPEEPKPEEPKPEEPKVEEPKELKVKKVKKVKA